MSDALSGQPGEVGDCRPDPARCADVVVDARGLVKVYRLYASPADQALDLLGMSGMLFWRRPRYAEHAALSNFDLLVRRGERIGVIGRNGAGKTTLLKLITGVAQPTAGTLSVNGEVQALMQVGLGFHPEFSGLANIKASLLYSGLSASQQDAATEDIISFCELGPYLSQPVKTYSLGMQSRLQFACATAIKPDILIVDEILGAGDAYFSTKSSMRMERLAKSGCTLLLVSHSMAQILQYCDRCIWVDGGKLRADGPPRQVVGQYEVYMQSLSQTLGGGASSQDPRQVDSRSFRLGSAVSESVAAGDDAGPAGPSQEKDPVNEPASEAQFVDTLAGGEKVYRWPGEAGPKLESLGLFVDGVETRTLPEGSDLEFRITVRNDTANELACRYQIVIFALDNRRLTRLLSPVDTFSGARHELRHAAMTLSPCLLQAGEYHINFAILPADAMLAGRPLRRFDLVWRFGDFEITRRLDYRERCIFSHPAQWTVGATQPTAI